SGGISRRGSPGRSRRGAHHSRSRSGRSASARPPRPQRRPRSCRIRRRAAHPGGMGGGRCPASSCGGFAAEVRTGAVVTVLGVVLMASALDLAIGVLWVTALLGVLFLRRRIRSAPVLLLLAAITLLVWGGRVGWFASQAPLSYTAGWVPSWGSRTPSGTDGDSSARIAEAREKLAAVSRDELRLTGPEIEQRAGALIALSRRIEPFRGSAPRETAAVETAV